VWHSLPSVFAFFYSVAKKLLDIHKYGQLTQIMWQMTLTVDTSARIYDDFLRLLFLHSHREASTLDNELPAWKQAQRDPLTSFLDSRRCVCMWEKFFVVWTCVYVRLYLESSLFSLLCCICHESPLLLTHMKRVLQHSYSDIFAVSVEQRQKWGKEIIGLHATLKGDTRSCIILIQNARYVKGHDPWGPRRWRLPRQWENVLCGQIEPATASPISLLQQVVWTTGLCLCSKVSEGGSRLATHNKDMESGNRINYTESWYVTLFVNLLDQSGGPLGRNRVNFDSFVPLV
jgi:hypothetical protein